jgi:glycosyltransferase involved in cell wall biosynthesis
VPDAKLVLVGDGPQRQSLLDRIRRLGVADGVTMTGAVDNVEQYMREFTCLVLPSAFEGFPNVVMEALSLGIPVVARPVGDLEEIVLEGRTGRLVREDTPTALAFLLSQVVEDESLRRNAAEQGPEMIRTQYSVAAALDKLLTVYNGLTANAPSPRS